MIDKDNFYTVLLEPIYEQHLNQDTWRRNFSYKIMHSDADIPDS